MSHDLQSLDSSLDSGCRLDLANDFHFLTPSLSGFDGGGSSSFSDIASMDEGSQGNSWSGVFNGGAFQSFKTGRHALYDSLGFHPEAVNPLTYFGQHAYSYATATLADRAPTVAAWGLSAVGGFVATAAFAKWGAAPALKFASSWLGRNLSGGVAQVASDTAKSAMKIETRNLGNFVAVDSKLTAAGNQAYSMNAELDATIGELTFSIKPAAGEVVPRKVADHLVRTTLKEYESLGAEVKSVKEVWTPSTAAQDLGNIQGGLRSGATLNDVISKGTNTGSVLSRLGYELESATPSITNSGRQAFEAVFRNPYAQ